MRWLFFILILAGSAFMAFSSSWALVLTGGGARGAYEAGSLRAINQLDLDVKGVYGTSVGALNGIFYCQGETEKLYKIWQDLSYSDVMSVNASSTTNMYFHVAREILSFHLLNVEPLREIVKENIDEKRIRDSGIDFGLVTYDLSKFSPVELYLSQIPKGQLLDYVLASANYPIFQRQVINGQTYIDGGVYNNAPVNMAIEKGFKKILLINVSDIPFSLPQIPKDVELKIITPSGTIGSAMDFNPTDERRLEKMGYLDTLKAFGKFVGRDYYIYPPKSPVLINALLSMNATELSKVAGILDLNIGGYSHDLAVYEVLIPKILQTVKATSFDSLNLDLLEMAASTLDVNRLTPYTQRELVMAIAKSDQKLRTSFLFFQISDNSIVESVREICKFIVSSGMKC
ncbi:patatin-like phospholipase family protein [Athalassotoga sp.]|uniref:patatin-like phospholipase family protein n=1 Tax=Athalassotoga sp. TaxID=2022597 RepID=UPI003D05E5E1